ncbi:hypothetical protein ABZY81_38435 [Streptomyces sp. NPDC006514]|uniref:hypothetical protein n=1 Tax=Streptomyces sp. NPDC006514 TaxID=3154308 RepID=UPI0033BE366E
MVGTAPDGSGLCAGCCGDTGRYPACRGPADLLGGGRCARCTLADRVNDLLAGDRGAVPAQLAALAGVLTGADNPYPVLSWLHRSQAARLLAHLAGHDSPISHELLDNLPQNAPTRHVRGLLITAGVLPRRHEHLAHLEHWITHTMPALLAPHHTPVIRPFAEWHVLRDARRRTTRNRYSVGAAKADVTEIRTAIAFLTWLDSHQTSLAAADQPLFEQWMNEHRTRVRQPTSFIRWTRARGLNTTLTTSRRPRQFADSFLTEHDYTHHLRRCLTDSTLPRVVRIMGALVLLYALPLSRISELTTTQFRRTPEGAFLTLGRHPVLVPPRLALLIAEQTENPASGYFRRQLDDGTHYLLPGQAPGRARNPLRGGRPPALTRSARSHRTQYRNDRSRHRPAADHRCRSVRREPRHGQPLGQLCQRQLEPLPGRSGPGRAKALTVCATGCTSTTRALREAHESGSEEPPGGPLSGVVACGRSGRARDT